MMIKLVIIPTWSQIVPSRIYGDLLNTKTRVVVDGEKEAAENGRNQDTPI